MAWFEQQDSAVQAAIITGVLALLGTIITVLASIWKKKKESKNAVNVTQTISGNDNTVIGIQKNEEKN